MKKTGRFILLTIGLILVTTFCITSTVMSHSNENFKIEESYYRQIEQEYVKDIKRCLQEAGYKNSGVMLTRVVDEKGQRLYTVTIHNEKLNRLSEDEKEHLKETLEAFSFESPDCNFFHKFLES